MEVICVSEVTCLWRGRKLLPIRVHSREIRLRQDEARVTGDDFSGNREAKC
jgi:hypothetical protein